MRVMHVAEVLKGGTASYIDEVLAFQKRMLGAEQISVVVPASQKADLTAAHNLTAHTFDDTGKRLGHVKELIRLVREAVRDNPPDIIHAHGTFAGVACRAAFAFSRHKPVIVYCSHGWAFDREGSRSKNRVLAGIEWLLSWWAQKIICISEHDWRSGRAAGISAGKLVTVRNGIADLPAASVGESPWPQDDRLKVLFVGRFDRQKGVDVFFKAMAQAQDRCTGFAIGDASVGDAPAGDPPPNVHLTGWLTRKEVQAYVQGCDVFVMPSRWEGFGLSALEAMRAGKAVVASRVGGLLELVADGDSGVLFEPDNVEQLAQVLQRLDRGEVQRMGLAARQRYLRYFTADDMNRSIMKVYAEALGQPVEAVSFG